MEIRKADKEDIPAIIDLFKISLGEDGGVPSTAFWHWKHYDNPFGTSPTLLMVDKEKVVGLRTFMYWRWRTEKKVYPSLRCVDTATHPDYRGKGIFKKLTIKLLQEVEEESLATFIYNTPNAMSMPGYLKMGWEVAGQTPLYIKPQGINFIRSIFTSSVINDRSIDEIDIENLLVAWRSQLGDQLTTDYSKAYFKWRYQDVPGINYHFWVDDETITEALFFYRIKATKGISELRVLDLLYVDEQSLKRLLSGIKEVARKHRAMAVTILKPYAWTAAFLKKQCYFPVSKKGLTVTKKGVNNHSIYHRLDPMDSWELSSGAIELF